MSITNLLAALIAVESDGNDMARGRHGDLGALQVRPCVVADVNRLKGTHYRHSEMANRKLRATLRSDAWQGAKTTRSWIHSATNRSLWNGNETSRPSNGKGGQRAAFLNLRRLRPIIQRNAPEIRRRAADVRE